MGLVFRQTAGDPVKNRVSRFAVFARFSRRRLTSFGDVRKFPFQRLVKPHPAGSSNRSRPAAPPCGKWDSGRIPPPAPLPPHRDWPEIESSQTVPGGVPGQIYHMKGHLLLPPALFFSTVQQKSRHFARFFSFRTDLLAISFQSCYDSHLCEKYDF